MPKLERGYAAFKHMMGADEFLETIRQREMEILERIFSGITFVIDPESLT